MHLEFFFENLLTAGYAMAKLATKFGAQSELKTGSFGYRVSCDILDKKQAPIIRAYIDGLKDGMEVKHD